MSNSPHTVSVRDAEISELPAVSQLIAGAYEEHLKLVSDGFVRRFRSSVTEAELTRGEGTVMVAETSRGIVGTVVFHPVAARWHEFTFPADWSAVRLLAVASSERRGGAGLLLMEECVRRARQADSPCLGLYTAPMMKAARALYEKMGFVRIPAYDNRPETAPPALAYALGLKPRKAV